MLPHMNGWVYQQDRIEVVEKNIPLTAQNFLSA